MTSFIVTNPNESCSAVVRSNQAVLAAASGDNVVAEVNEVCSSTHNEVLYEECDNFECHSSTYVSTTENVAYGQVVELLKVKYINQERMLTLIETALKTPAEINVTEFFKTLVGLFLICRFNELVASVFYC